MLKSAAKKHFKSLSGIAKALSITKSSVSQWGRVVPRGSAFELQAVTRGRLKVNPALYRNTRRGSAGHRPAARS